MFLERLGTVIKRIDGALALSLVDGDGIPIEAVNSRPEIDLEALAAESVAQLRSVADTHADLAAGSLRHYCVETGTLTLMVSFVTEGYYLLLMLDPGSNLGRARFELRRAQILLEQDLS